MIGRIADPRLSVWLDLWGGTSGTFAGLDQFNRVIDQRWTSASSVESQNQVTTTPTDIDRYQYGYDQNSNRLYKANVVGTAAVSWHVAVNGAMAMMTFLNLLSSRFPDGEAVSSVVSDCFIGGHLDVLRFGSCTRHSLCWDDESGCGSNPDTLELVRFCTRRIP